MTRPFLAVALLAAVALCALPLQAQYQYVGYPPVAQFSVWPEEPVANALTQFTDESYDDDAIVDRDWDFGDDETAGNDTQPGHIYDQPGEYTVTLWVKDSDGLQDVETRTIVVAPAPEPDPVPDEPVSDPYAPTPDFELSPSWPTAQNKVQFIDRSTDPDDGIVWWSWAFGDGAVAENELRPWHTYLVEGDYQVALVVRDAAGNEARLERTITVGPYDPDYDGPTSVVYPGDDYGAPAPGLLSALATLGLAAAWAGRRRRGAC